MNQEGFVQRIAQDLATKVKHNKLSVEKLAASFGIKDKTLVKELTELAIVNRARMLAHQSGTVKGRFVAIVDLYQSQVNLSHRTSQSILLQQYSTPAPIAYLAGVFAHLDKGVSVLEPSAGNGLLTIAADPRNVTVNEIDPVRRSNLETQGFHKVLNQDATQPFSQYTKAFDAVITNPPFGVLDKAMLYDKHPIRVLDHLMALRALDTMRDDGKAAIIIGGHTRWDAKGRIQAGKNMIFFNYLYTHYYVTDVINIDGHKLYSRQGTAFDVRLILIDGRKFTPQGVAPTRKEYDVVVSSFEELFERIIQHIHFSNMKPSANDLEAQALALEEELNNLSGLKNSNRLPIVRLDEFIIGRKHYLHFRQGKKEWYRIDDGKTYTSKEISKSGFIRAKRKKAALDGPYHPASQSCTVLDTQVPDSMDFETHTATAMIREAVGGDMDELVRQRLGYSSKAELCKALSAEQIDAVGMSIYNIEARGQGMIIGDQTGIGKGRVAASIIRYGIKQGHKPIFITEKANLFSDIYRDLTAIGFNQAVPFIVNGRESKTDIKDENGEIVYQAMIPSQQTQVFKSKKIPADCNFVVATYSQFNSPEKKPEKPAFLQAIAEDNIVILDESHNASGSSNTGEFLQSVLSRTKGVVFLSATFAKRPDNMPVYAMKTAMSDANMTKADLVEAITKGGVALQEVLASQLVKEGQMLRRERSFEGVEVNYITLEDHELEHRAIADNITEVLRDIIAFQSNFVDKQVNELDDIAVEEGKRVAVRGGTSEAGVSNEPYFSKVFNVINQMLFSLKAEAVAVRAIERLKEGKKPVIAFASTMGSFIEQMQDQQGLPVQNGSIINADFTEVLQRGLDGILRYTEKAPDGSKEFKELDITELSMQAQAEYQRIGERIRDVSTGITISPIDVIIAKIQKAGYTVAEVTGRKLEVQINPKTNQGLVMLRKRINTNDAFRQFNNNEVDVLMINQSGSTGASAHAIVTSKVPSSEVKQRVMIVLQAELDINTEVQKRGRINRTGQILKPIYDYVNSAIPAEKRLMMMLQKKLKSLDANTSSNQKQSTKILDVPDFLNKYGDKVVGEYLKENPAVNKLLDDPLDMLDSSSDESVVVTDAAYMVSGRVAVLSTQMQQDFYNEISERYNDYTDYLKQIGEYDLEVEAMNLQAETISTMPIKIGKGGQSEFGDDSILEEVMANVLKKPFNRDELKNILLESSFGKDPIVQQTEIKQAFEAFMAQKLAEELKENNERYEALIKEIPQEKKIQKVLEKQGHEAWMKAVDQREKELQKAQQSQNELTEKGINNRKQYTLRLFKFFYTGKKVNYPFKTFEGGQELIMAVFLGFVIDPKKKNPYAASALKLRFALASSNKYIVLPSSYTLDVLAIMGASEGMNQPGPEELLKQWENKIKENVTDRRTRYIVTGNLLQAFADVSGKLVSYTTLSGEIKKGILLPENWTPSENIKGKTIVPIGKALKIIQSLVLGNALYTNNGIGIIRQRNNYKIIVPASRQKGGDIYLDPELLALVDKHLFEKSADKMVATIDPDLVNKLVERLQDQHNVSVTLNPSQFAQIKGELQKAKVRKLPRILLAPSQQPDINELELEAAALELELELLNLSQVAGI